MIVTFYQFTKRMNSTAQPSGGTEIDMVLKVPTDIYNPTFQISGHDMTTFTYAKWKNRYYYITNVSYVTNDIQSVTLTIDPLATWKSQIQSTTAFVLYATGAYNDEIPDTRLSTDMDATIKSNKASMLNEDGCYFVSFIGTNSNTHLVVKSFGEFNILCSKVMDTGLYESLLAEAQDFLSKKLNSASDCLIEAHYLPFTPELGGSMNILLGGGYNTEVQGWATDHNTSDSISVNIPWQYSDFRNRSQYTSLILYLPGYGAVSLNADDFVGKRSITIDIAFDPYSGGLTYKIEDIAKYDCNVAVPIQVGTSQGISLSSLASGIINTAVGAALGGGIGAVGGVFNTILSSMERNYGSNGSNGGSNSYDIEKQIVLTSICHNTNVEPSSMGVNYGRPLNAVRSFSGLSGYVQCANASVNCNAPDNLKEQINSYLNGGVYIE